MQHTERETRKEDRRITRTRTALRRAFRELVKEKGYEAVTIEEITERANLGRTTFYLHYHDKEDLFLEDFEKKLFAQAEEVAPRPFLKWFAKGEDNVVRGIFGLVLENQELFRSITQEQTSKIYNRFRDIHVRALSKVIQESPVVEKRAEKVNLSIDLILNYYAGALWSCILWWAERGFQPEADEMTDFFLSMFNPGLLLAIGGVKSPEILQAILKDIP